MNDLFERLKWGDPVLYPLMIFALIAVMTVVGYEYWQTTRTARSLREENERLITENEDANTRNSELEEDTAAVTQERAAVTLERDEARAQQDKAILERDDALAELADANTRIGELEADNKTLGQDLAAAKDQIAILNAENETQQDDLAAAIAERDDALEQRAAVTLERDEARAQRDTAIAERDEARADLEEALENQIIVYGSKELLETIELDIIQGTANTDEETLLLLVLQGELEEYTGRPDIYQTIGTITLPPGNWAFAERGIGGERRTGAGNSALHWEAVSSACVTDAAGSWYDAIQATCEVNIEWTVNSRYPYAQLLILPIDDLIPQEAE